MQGQEDAHGLVGTQGQGHRQGQGDHRQRPGHQPGGQQAPPGEDQHEAEQVEAQGRQPEQGKGGQIGADGRRGPDHQAGGQGGQRRPPQPPAQRRGKGRSCRTRVRVRGRGGRRPRRRWAPVAPSQGPGGAAEQEHHQQAVAQGPAASLGFQAPARLHQQGVGQETGQAAQVAGREEEVGVTGGGMPAGGEPALQQRTAAGHREVGQAHRRGHQPQEPQGGIVLGRGHGPQRQGDGEHQDRQQQGHQVEANLTPRPQSRGQAMHGGIGGQ